MSAAGAVAVREAPSPFGERLRAWRKRLGFSQMKLALESGVSARHLCFLENGRSRPSQEMVVRLCQAMDLPLRETNTLLAAAGFASLYAETPLDAPEMEGLRRILWKLIEQYDPYPAFLMDRSWNVLLANAASAPCFAPFVNDAEIWRAQPLNLLRITLHPDGLRRHLLNWEDVASEALSRVQREEAYDPSDEQFAALVREVESYPDLPDPHATRARSVAGPVLPLHFKTGDLELRMFSTITTVGAPGDITLQGLRIEGFVPADDGSDAVLRDLVERFREPSLPARN